MLSLVVTHDQDRVIGHKGEQPWYLPAAHDFLKIASTKNTLVMGRKTYELIGRPIPNRKTVVVSKSFPGEAGVEVIRNINLLKLCKSQPGEYFIIGGESIFNQTISFVDKIYLFRINQSFIGDAYFPSINLNEWNTVYQMDFEVNTTNPYPYSFNIYERRGDD